MDNIPVQIVEMDCIREAHGACSVVDALAKYDFFWAETRLLTLGRSVPRPEG